MNQKKIKAVISDLDGTLLSHEHVVSAYTKEVIQALTEEGIHFMIATGRHYMDAGNIKERLGVETYMIAANGATVTNHAGELVFQAEISRDVVKAILEIPTDVGVYKNLYQGEHWLMEEHDRVFNDYYQEGDFVYQLCQFEEHLHLPINKVFFTSKDNAKLTKIADIVKAQFSEHVEVTFSLPQCLEIMPKGVNKGSAILAMLEKFDIHPDEVIAFGDGLNDYEMLQVVGKGYLMGNANHQLKERLPEHEVIGYNSEDAVARQIVKVFNLQGKVPYKAAI